MPLHKTRPVARKECSWSNRSGVSGINSPSPSRPPPVTDKSNRAAQMAQELASQSSWADAYAPSTPATTATPVESVADTQSQLDESEPPPSYEAARLERELPSIPQERSVSVHQDPSSTIETPTSPRPRDIEVGVATPLLYQQQEIVIAKKRKQRRFVVVFIFLAVWLMIIQSIKGAAIGFWRSGEGVSIPPLPKRTYTRHETSTAITGTFTFYDGLDLSTTSGSINIVIDPQPSDKIGTLRLVSRSGSIKVRFSEEYMKGLAATGFLDRVYDIEIRSSSGSHNVEIPQGNGGTTSFVSDSGSMNLKLHTTHLSKNSNVTTLSTQSGSGSQTIKIKPASSEPIASLAGKHIAKGSGTIKLYLPSTWEGMVHTFSEGSGSVDVKGDDLQYQRNGSKEIYAWRLRDDGSGKPPSQGQAIEVRGESSGSIKVDCSAS